MKIVYAGADARMSVAPLQALLAAGFDIAAVVTQPDLPVGRKRLLTPNAVKVCAQGAGLPVYCFERIRDHAAELAALGCGAMVTCAYGQILSKQILLSFPRGVWNLHASLLPKFRGASPIQAAILAGKSHTGVTVMKTEEALDSGDILLVKRCAIGGKTCGELSEVLSLLSAEAAVEAVEYIASGNIQLIVQDDCAATYCKKIKKEDARLNFAEASACVRLINAMSPSPLAYCYVNGVQLNIYAAELCSSAPEGGVGEVVAADKTGITVCCNSGAFKILKAQFAGGRPLSAADIVNGRKLKAGEILD